MSTRTKEPVINGMKKCLKCEEPKPIEEYYRRKEIQGHIPYCKECYRAKQNKRYQLIKIIKFPF